MSGTIVWKDEYVESTPFINCYSTRRGVFYTLSFLVSGEMENLYSYKMWHDFPEGSIEYRSRSFEKELYLFKSQSEALEYYIRKVYGVSVDYPLNLPLSPGEHYSIAQVAYEALELREFDLRAELR